MRGCWTGCGPALRARLPAHCARKRPCARDGRVFPNGCVTCRCRPRVILSNKISSTHTVVEVNGRDFPGLVYRITRVLADLGLQIQTATVSTYGERVVDVFYVKDLYGLQVHNEARLEVIRSRLLGVFNHVNEAAE